MPFSERAERQALVGLVAAMCVSALVILMLGRDLGFYADELDWLTAFDNLSPRALLTPHNSHLIALPRVIYEVVPRGFGTSYLPFRLLNLAGVLACAALVFVLVRRRLGGPVALAPAIVLLFFGSSHEIVLSPLGIPIIFAIAFGLAAVVATELETPAGDRTAFALLILAILSHSFGLIIALGVATQIAFTPERWRRVWIAAVPIALWIVWWIWARQFDQGITSFSNLPGTPLYILEAAASAASALTGTGPEFGGKADWLQPIVEAASAVVALAGLVILSLRIRRAGASSYLWGFLAMALLFWFSTSLSEGSLREPTMSRYQFFGAIAIVLIAAETLRGREIRHRAAVVLVCLFALALVGNGLRLVFGADRLTDQGAEVKAQLAMIELAGDSADPAFAPASVSPRGSNLIGAQAGQLLRFDETVGPLGYSIEQVREQPENVRANADFVLARAVGLLAIPAAYVDLGQRPSCHALGTSSGSQARIPLQPGPQVVTLTDGPSQPLLLGRFADAATVPGGRLTTEADIAIVVPADGAADPWFATVTGRVQICSPSPPVA